MDIFFKIILSIFVLGLISVATALAVAAPVAKGKNEKRLEIKRTVVFLAAVTVALYFIWLY